MELTKVFLNDCFKYNDDTDEVSWRFRPLHQFKSERDCNTFNGLYAKNKVGMTANKNGYPVVNIYGKPYMLHRIVWIMHHGDIQGVIDHINGDRSDYSIVNLRDVSQQENMKNKGLHPKNKTGVSGVQLKENGKYVVSIRANLKQKYLGTFNNLFDACCARKSAEYKAGFHENHGRS